MRTLSPHRPFTALGLLAAGCAASAPADAASVPAFDAFVVAVASAGSDTENNFISSEFMEDGGFSFFEDTFSEASVSRFVAAVSSASQISLVQEVAGGFTFEGFFIAEASETQQSAEDTPSPFGALSISSATLRFIVEEAAVASISTDFTSTGGSPSTIVFSEVGGETLFSFVDRDDDDLVNSDEFDLAAGEFLVEVSVEADSAVPGSAASIAGSVNFSVLDAAATPVPSPAALPLGILGLCTLLGRRSSGRSSDA